MNKLALALVVLLATPVLADAPNDYQVFLPLTTQRYQTPLYFRPTYTPSPPTPAPPPTRTPVPTPRPTSTPIPTPTPVPVPTTSLLVYNGTEGTLRVEVVDSGIGVQFLLEGLRVYGTFPAGYYNWNVTGCGGGTLWGAGQFVPGFRTMRFVCNTRMMEEKK